MRALVRRTSRREGVAGCVDEWVVGDLVDPQSQAGLVAGAECVIHAAVDFGVTGISPTLNLMKNVVPSLQLLEAARVAGVEQFEFVSSGMAYEEILQDRKLDENHPTWPGELYGAYKASVEPFLKAYHVEFGMNTSSWRPVAVYGVDPVLERSRWYDLVSAAKEGRDVASAGGGKIVQVQDVADALVYAVGDGQVAGRFYNLVDRHMYWQVAAEMAKEMAGSASKIEDRKGAGPKNTYDTHAAVEFFERHGNTLALRRGLNGVREYVGELLKLL